MREDRSIQELLQWGSGVLNLFGLEDPLLEARALMTGLLQCSTSLLHLEREKVLGAQEMARFHDMINRRSKKEPVAYILGSKYFMDLEFVVDPRVFIPRPETEHLVESALQKVRETVKGEAPLFLDVGTGSGAIAISLAQIIPDSKVYALDKSWEALSLAQINADAHNVTQRVRFLRSDLYEKLSPEFFGYFDIILSNPPYIASPELETLPSDIFFEPRLALDGGKDGLAVIRSLIQEGAKFLKTRGWMILEIGYQQGPSVRQIFTQEGYRRIFIGKDFNGHDRIVGGERIGSV